MRTLNLGILAHVDAGKTTLTERLLFSAGAIDQVGSVDAGTTQTDSLDLERERGITIRSAVASLQVGDLAINLVDTPGHPDFIAEVERVLGVLDGAILVLSAVEGVQPQTPLLFRALERLNVPSLIFVNKVDRAGADPDAVLATMRRRLAPGIIAMEAVRGVGTPEVVVSTLPSESEPHRTELLEVLAANDEAILDAYVREETAVGAVRLREALAEQTKRGLVHPAFFGSAMRGIGHGELMSGVTELLAPAPGDADAPTSGRVFKIERTRSGERLAYVRMFAGSLRARERVRVGGDAETKPTSVKVFAPTGSPRRDRVLAGEMAAVRGLGAVRVGDAIGLPPPGEGDRARFPRPALEAVVFPLRQEQAGALRAALVQLAEQDPLINVRQDDHRGEISVSLYGDVQKEVIGATLERDYGIAVDFRETTVVCIERPVRTAEAEELLSAPTKTNITGRSSPLSTNPFRATLALRIGPAAPGSGVAFAVDVEPRLLPLYIYRTPEAFAGQMEVYVREALAEGLAGWEVTDCQVTLTDCGYGAPATTAADFRRLTMLVLAMALDRAGTWVCEPLAELALEMPSHTAHAVLATLARLGGRVTGQFSGGGMSHVSAILPVARLRTLRGGLNGLTAGEGVLDVRPGGYQPVGDNPPTRPRTGPSPLDRDAWLASLARRG
jgi:ribosomal protection tetracycline resistance protein